MGINLRTRCHLKELTMQTLGSSCGLTSPGSGAAAACPAESTTPPARPEALPALVTQRHLAAHLAQTHS